MAKALQADVSFNIVFNGKILLKSKTFTNESMTAK